MLQVGAEASSRPSLSSSLPLHMAWLASKWFDESTVTFPASIGSRIKTSARSGGSRLLWSPPTEGRVVGTRGQHVDVTSYPSNVLPSPGSPGFG